jgi:hypothetical protein
MQIEGGLDAEGLAGIKVEHTATLVNRRLK